MDINYSLETDESLADLLKKGDQDAYAELYARYSQRILHFLYRMVGKNPQIAQDLLHDVFLKLIHIAHQFTGKGSFKSWIFAIASNHCRNYLTRDRFRNKLSMEEEELELGEEPVHNSEELSLFQKDLSIALEKISYEYRSVFVLFYKEGLSLEEISEVCKCPIGTIKSRLFQARKQLSKILQHYKEIMYES